MTVPHDYTLFVYPKTSIAIVLALGVILGVYLDRRQEKFVNTPAAKTFLKPRDSTENSRVAYYSADARCIGIETEVINNLERTIITYKGKRSLLLKDSADILYQIPYTDSVPMVKP